MKNPHTWPGIFIYHLFMRIPGALWFDVTVTHYHYGNEKTKYVLLLDAERSSNHTAQNDCFPGAWSDEDSCMYKMQKASQLRTNRTKSIIIVKLLYKIAERIKYHRIGNMIEQLISLKDKMTFKIRNLFDKQPRNFEKRKNFDYLTIN